MPENLPTAESIKTLHKKLNKGEKKSIDKRNWTAYIFGGDVGHGEKLANKKIGSNYFWNR